MQESQVNSIDLIYSLFYGIKNRTMWFNFLNYTEELQVYGVLFPFLVTITSQGLPKLYR